MKAAIHLIFAAFKMNIYNVDLPTGDIDTDNRIPLPPGTSIIDKHGITYTIQAGKTTSGGSSLLYKATRDGSVRNFILKECYPRSKKFEFTRINGVVYPKNDSTEALEYLSRIKANMANENKIGQLISNKTGRIVSAWEDLSVEKIILYGKSFDASNACFIVMENATSGNERGWFLEDVLMECSKPMQDNAPLRNGGLPSPIVVAVIMEELLKALRDLHRAGYIHGDIQDKNICFLSYDLESGDIGVGQLFDFGNSRKLLPDGKTEVISDQNIFSTRGYYSPEILTKNDGTLRLTPATDIFSAGCLMLYLFKGMDYCEICGDEIAKTFSMTAPIEIEELTERGYKLEAALLFSKILSKALAYKPKNRYKDAAEMLKDIIFLKKILAPPKFALSRNLSRSPYFVNGSRDRELEKLKENLEGGMHPLWIWGIGGVGKTELAMEFARREIECGRAAYLVSFRGSMKETVLQMNFSGRHFEFDGQDNNSDAEYKARLDLLKENYQDALLIIDNFERDDKTISELQAESEYLDIVGLNMKILFTTRSRPNDSVSELMPLDEDNAFSLFKSILKNVPPADEEIVHKLICEVQCHPMTVEILAKMINVSWGTLTAKELLFRLKTNRINSDSLPNIEHRKIFSVNEAKIYGHLRTLFKLFNVDENYREILAHVTLLPAEGFDAREFVLSEDYSKKKFLMKIEGHGWIRRRAEDNSLWIHPLIRTVLKNEIKPNNSDCEKFLNELWKRLDDKYPPDKNLFKQAAEIYDNAIKDLGDVNGEHNFRAGYCFLISENYLQANLREKMAITLREQIGEVSYVKLARNYNDAGVASFFLGDFDSGMNFLSKAIKILEANNPNDPNAANIYSNVSDAYLQLGHYEKAVDLAERAVTIFSKTPPKNLHEYANAHRVFGMTLFWVKRYDGAIKEFFAAEKIFHELAPEGSTDLALIYSNIGELYGVKGDTNNALNYLFKSLKLQERLLPKNHNDLLISYDLISTVFLQAGNEVESKKFSELRNAAFKDKQTETLKTLLKSTLDLIDIFADEMTDEVFIKRYTQVADCYRKLGDLLNAREYISQAHEKISDNIAPPVISLIYSNYADICNDDNDLPSALEFSQKAIDIVENALPKDFGLLSTNYMHHGNLAYKSNKLEDALNDFQRAIEFQIQCSPPDYDNVKILQNFIGTILMQMKRYDEAEEIFTKLLQEWSNILHENHPILKNINDQLEILHKSRAE